MSLVFAIIVIAVYLSPLLIQLHTPCLSDQIPPKPKLIGHRGAPMVGLSLSLSLSLSLELIFYLFEKI